MWSVCSRTQWSLRSLGPLQHFVDLESLSSLTLVGDIVMNSGSVQVIYVCTESHGGLLVQDNMMHILKKFLRSSVKYVSAEEKTEAFLVMPFSLSH